VTLRRVASLRGRVVSTDGSPVAGARVEQGRPPFAVRGDEGAAGPFAPGTISDRSAVFADGEGRFEIDWVVFPPDGAPARVWAMGPGHGIGEVSVADPGAGEALADVTISLEPRERTWLFRVRDEAGRPIAGAVVGQPQVYPAALTADDGTARVALAAHPDDALIVSARAAGFAPRKTTVDRDDPARVVDLVLLPARPLLVRTTDADGRPVSAAVQVVLADLPAATPLPLLLATDPRCLGNGTTDAGGWLRFDDLPPGRLLVFASRWYDPANSARVEAAPETASVEVRLPKARPGAGSVVEGEVADAEGRPVTRYTATLTWDVGTRSLPAALAGRRFRFEGVPAGSYVLQVRTDPSRIAGELPLEVAAGKDSRGVRVVLGDPATLVGTLRRSDGGPVGRMTAMVFSAVADAGWRAQAETDATGAFEVAGLPAGDYRLRLAEIRPRAGDPPLREVDGRFTLARGERAVRVFDVVPAARLWVRCDDDRFATDLAALYAAPSERQDPRGKASRETVVRVIGEDGREVTLGALLCGRQALDEGLAPGRYRVRANGPLGSFVGEVTVTGPGDVEVEVRPAPPEAR
jgi:hypothetical protein